MFSQFCLQNISYEPIACSINNFAQKLAPVVWKV